MTIKEKINLAAQPNMLYLFKEGMFYKVYNQNAMWFVNFIKPYKVAIKYIKNIQKNVYSIGFPINYLNNLSLQPMAVQNTENSIPQLICYTIKQQPIKQKEYINWCASLPNQNQPITLKTNRHTNIITQLQNFEMATTTPIQAFEFLLQLKKTL